MFIQLRAYSRFNLANHSELSTLWLTVPYPDLTMYGEVVGHAHNAVLTTTETTAYLFLAQRRKDIKRLRAAFNSRNSVDLSDWLFYQPTN
jgi:hypothetical protein